MTTAKWILQLLLSTLALLSVTVAAEAPVGYNREICKYRKGKLIQPVTENRRRLYAAREQMRVRSSLNAPSIDGYILPSYDEHLNREVARPDQRLQYLTGFTGIDAFAVITLKGAALFLQHRYAQQADGELDCDWEIFLISGNVTIADWLTYQLHAEQRVGADPHIVPHFLWMSWDRELKDKLLHLTRIDNNLIDLIWDEEVRPKPDMFAIQVQERSYAGESWQDKVTELRKNLTYHKCDAMIITSLTEIAYLLNIRGRDIPYTPVVKSYLIVTHSDIFFYVDHYKFTLGIDLHLHTDCYNEKCVKIKDYKKIWSDIRTYVQSWKRVLIPAHCVQELGASEAIFSSVPLKLVHERISPIIFMRAEKNFYEQAGMREAHIRDGAALCEAMSNLETRFFTEQWTEEKIKYEVERSRLSQNHAKGLSLRTVVAYGEHSALPYYISSNVTDIEVTDQSLLVIESGSHYFEGTTDVTRTHIFGEPTPQMKKAYTNVLSGLLSLSQFKFPSGLKASEVDALVRKHVWASMTDYPATGHGIGAFGAVEEPPISVAYGQNSSYPFQEGYFFSSESGFFHTGEFGARLRNVLEVIDTGRIHTSGSKFLAFQDVTLVPYEPKLIDGTMLSVAEKHWLNEYNAKIRQLIGEELKRQGNMQAFYWMMNKTRHIREYLPEAEYRGVATGSGTRTRSFLTVTVPAVLLGITIFGSFLRWLL